MDYHHAPQMSALTPIYKPLNCSVSFHLDWTVTCFWRVPLPDPKDWFPGLTCSVQNDKIRLLKHQFSDPNISQFLLGARPRHAPSQIVRSVKSRLQHLLAEGQPRAFKRNYNISSVGSTRVEKVAAYIRKQMDHHTMADPRTQEFLRSLRCEDMSLDLSTATGAAHGLCIAAYHIVLTFEERWIDPDKTKLRAVLELLPKISTARGYRLRSAAFGPGHIHMLVGADVSSSPEGIALCYMTT